jgi:hypothetical protein
MNIGTKVIVTHDRTGHGIKPGKVVTIASRCEYIVKVLVDGEIKVVEMDDLANIEPHQYVEAVLQERDYQRFWLNFRLAGFGFVSLVLLLFAIGFLYYHPVLGIKITGGFVCFCGSLFAAFIAREEKIEREEEILKIEL